MRKTDLRYNLKILKTNKTRQSKAYKALSEIRKETPEKIYAKLCDLDIYDLFSIKSVVQNCIKEDKRFLTTLSKSIFVFLSTLLSILIGAVSGYIASNAKSPKELWRELNNVIVYIEIIGAIMLFMFLFYTLYKYLHSTHDFNEYRLVLILDYAIEIKKEEEKNKVIKITGKRLRRPVRLGRRKLKSTSK